MANRRILQYPNPRLRRVSTDIDFNSEDPTQIVQDLLDTLDVSSGVGLAAPQIGYEINKSLYKLIDHESKLLKQL